MNKDTRKYLIGVALGFIGIILYTFMLKGYENIYIEDVQNIIRQAAVPFLFTEMWVVITVEGLKSLKQEFIKFKARLTAKKISKEEKGA